MLHIIFALACLCSHYAVASEKEQSDKIAKKAYYDKLISEIKDEKVRADYEKGYIVLGEGDDIHIIPYSEIYLPVPIGNEGNFMSFHIDNPIHEELRKKQIATDMVRTQ